MSTERLKKWLVKVASSPRALALLLVSYSLLDWLVFKVLLVVILADFVRKWFVIEERMRDPERFKVVVGGAGISGRD